LNASALTEGELLDQLPVGVVFIEGRSIVHCNRLLEQMLGYPPGELAGKPLRVLFRSEPAWPVPETEAELVRKDGAALPCRLVTRVLGPESASLAVLGREAESYYVRFLAYHDALTGLPNRRLLDDRLAQALSAARRHNRKLAALLLDLEGFRQVNETRGRRAGDGLLRDAAQRLAACVRKGDTLARYGGDEFMIVTPEVQNDADCRIVAERLLRALAPECDARLGISLFPGDAPDRDALLRNADAALYRAKQTGKRYSFYGK
jgi:diguanylate cyclase (GGDEF)-like protein